MVERPSLNGRNLRLNRRHFTLDIQIAKRVVKCLTLRARFDFSRIAVSSQSDENNTFNLMNAIGERFQPLDL
jgi:hypothetical protein